MSMFIDLAFLLNTAFPITCWRISIACDRWAYKSAQSAFRSRSRVSYHKSSQVRCHARPDQGERYV